MRILVTGSTGQLGKAIIRRKPSKYQLLLPQRNQLDLSNKVSCRNYIEKYKPEFVINSGAFTNVDLAENQVDLCYSINTEAPSIFANELIKYGGKLLQISTDYVFDGCKNSPYKVKDLRNPISSYGYSKAVCEENIEKILKPSNQVVILRTSWLMGPNGKNFLSTIINLHRKRKNFPVVSDQIGAMSSTFDVAKVCWSIVNNWNLISKRHYLNHWTCDGLTSWYDIAVAIGDIATKYKILKNPAKIIPIKTENYPTLAKRPKYSILDCSSTKEILNIDSIDWINELETIISKLINQ